MIVVTTPFLSGHRIVESKGMVFGLVVRSRGLGGNLMAGLRSLGGGEIHEYTSLLEDTRRQALDRLVPNATLLGANAVLSMRFDSSELSGTMSEIVAYGTAVVVAPGERRGAARAPRRSNDRGPQPGAPPGHRRRDRDRAPRAVPDRPSRWTRDDRRHLHGARWAGAHRRCGHRAVRYRSEAGDRDGAPPGPRRRRATRHAARAPLPADRRGLHRPDLGSADARLARPVERRSAVRRRGLRAGVLSSPAGPLARRRPRTKRPETSPWPRSIQASPPVPPVPSWPRARAARPRAKVTFPYLNRELSWLEFNARVLHEARDERNPLLERVKFLAIFAGNLDEFFQVRVAGLRQQVEAGKVARSPDGRTAEEQLAAARERVLELVADHSAIFVDVRRTLAAEGVELVEYAAIPEHHDALRQRFLDEIFPVLTPLAVDPGHPFPYISTLSLSIAVGLRDPETGERGFARVKVPQILPRLLEVEPSHFVLIDQVIEANLDTLFTGMEVEEHHLFRVTRNADFEIEEDEADDLLLAIEEELRRRRFGAAVRLEVERSMPPATRALLQRGLGLAEADMLRHQRHARPDRPVGHRRARPAGPQARPVVAGHAAAAPAARRRRAGRRVRRDPRRRHPRPPPVRVVRGHDRAVHHPGGRRPGRPDHQADAVPDVGRLADRPVAHPGGRARQAGRGPGRDQGPLRRGGEHRLGAQAGARRAPTSSTAWSGSRRTPRRRSSSGARAPGFAATSTSGRATTTRRPPGSTSTSAC